jgi:DMSO/TMAO reductase YedYZ molybdopterin-dependent catalytic subunit
MKTAKTHPISQHTLSRRTWLQWAGQGAVLALGGSALAACLADVGPDATGQDVPDGGASQTGFAFEPGPENLSVYDGWGERTVDKQDLADILRAWRLRVDGLVETPGEYSFADLLALPRLEPIVDFHCVEGWSVYDVPWNGFHLDRLLDKAKVKPGASHVTFHTLGGKYNESVPIDVAREPKTLLAYGIGGSTLPLKHGFPLRLVIPRLLAYKSAKYVQRIELTDHAVAGYWVKAGYPYDAEVPEQRLRPGKY